MPGQWPHTTQYNRMMGLSSPLLESVITIVNMPNECKPAVVSFLSRFRQICSLFLTDRTQTIFFHQLFTKYVGSSMFVVACINEFNLKLGLRVHDAIE